MIEAITGVNITTIELTSMVEITLRGEPLNAITSMQGKPFLET